MMMEQTLMSACGPVQLLHSARKAVKEVASPGRAKGGQWPIAFYEETLGS